MKSNASEKPLAIFVVEDDLWYGELLVHHLQLNPENKVKRFESGKELIKALDEKPNIIILDYSLPDIKGDELLKVLKSKAPDSEIVIVSGQEDINITSSEYVHSKRLPYQDWDIKNQSGIPVASGLYIIYVDVPGVGEKILKWYGVMRPLDLQSY